MTADPISAGRTLVAGFSGAPTTIERPNVTNGQRERVPFTATLNAKPYKVGIGEPVVVTGSGFPAGATVELVWHSFEGRYETQGMSEFVGQRYDPVAWVVATVKASAAGEVEAEFLIPVDFGGPHDIRGRVEGDEIAQTGVTVTPVWSMTPTEGPIGTPIELKIIGIDIRTTMNTWHLLWDNHYFGMVTGVTTRGIGIARFRAAGPPGTHYVAAWNNSYQASPYLAWDSSPFQDEFDVGLDFAFTVTEDPGPLAPEVDDFSASDNPWPIENPGRGTLALSRDRGHVGDAISLSGKRLPADAHASLVWVTVVGDRVTHVGIRELRRNLGEIRTGADGTFRMDFKVPDDLGGSHRIEIMKGSEVLAAAGFVILPSVVSHTRKVRAGEKIAVHLKGGGWTTYDNTYTVTYDNSFIGYACGLSTNGDIQFAFTATGTPGTHIVDLYPTIYKGKDEMPKVYSLPQLTYAFDHPLRKTPAIRLSVEVTE